MHFFEILNTIQQLFIYNRFSFTCFFFFTSLFCFRLFVLSMRTIRVIFSQHSCRLSSFSPGSFSASGSLQFFPLSSDLAMLRYRSRFHNCSSLKASQPRRVPLRRSCSHNFHISFLPRRSRSSSFLPQVQKCSNLCTIPDDMDRQPLSFCCRLLRAISPCFLYNFPPLTCHHPKDTPRLSWLPLLTF